MKKKKKRSWNSKLQAGHWNHGFTTVTDSLPSFRNKITKWKLKTKGSPMTVFCPYRPLYATLSAKPNVPFLLPLILCNMYLMQWRFPLSKSSFGKVKALLLGIKRWRDLWWAAFLGVLVPPKMPNAENRDAEFFLETK